MTAAATSEVRNPNRAIAAPAMLGPASVPMVRAELMAASPAEGWSANTRELQMPCAAITLL